MQRHFYIRNVVSEETRRRFEKIKEQKMNRKINYYKYRIAEINKQAEKIGDFVHYYNVNVFKVNEIYFNNAEYMCFDLWLKVLGYLDAETLINLLCVNKFFQHTIRQYKWDKIENYLDVILNELRKDYNYFQRMNF